jgi:hypothetical protein
MYSERNFYQYYLVYLNVVDNHFGSKIIPMAVSLIKKIKNKKKKNYLKVKY